jgi:hypothetical protein
MALMGIAVAIEYSQEWRGGFPFGDYQILGRGG